MEWLQEIWKRRFRRSVGGWQQQKEPIGIRLEPDHLVLFERKEKMGSDTVAAWQGRII
jgi:hypothetical protein